MILSGLRVIDCGTYIAGPAAAVVLSDFGAEVIKIERPPYGDPYRYLQTVPGLPQSPVQFGFLVDDRNKKSIAIDLNDSEARDALLALIATADVFLTNYPAELIAKFHVSYDELRSVNPRLIYAHVTGYGEAGPDADRPGYDLTAFWARSGLMSQVYNEGADPTQSVAGMGDHPTSMALFGAVMLGLYQRQITGLGSKVSTSLIANGAWANSFSIQGAICGAQFPKRYNRVNFPNPIINHYVTRDGKRFIFCCLDARKDWPNLSRAIGRPELVADARFATPELRQQNGSELIRILDNVIATRDMSEWAAIFQKHEVIYGPVPDVHEVAEDPQMEASGVFVPGPEGLKTIDSPIRMLGVDKAPAMKAPGIGEHTTEIVRSIGVPEAAIEAMLARGAALSPPPRSTHAATNPNK